MPMCWVLLAAISCSCTPSYPLREDLRHFLKSYLRDTDIEYFAGSFDLNNDGETEAVVYLISPGYCGSGGCTTLVVTPESNSFRVISRITITRLPIRVLEESSHGWRNLSVQVQGGGIIRPYEAELRFDGNTYPTNPTMPPARRLRRESRGVELITEQRSQNSGFRNSEDNST